MPIHNTDIIRIFSTLADRLDNPMTDFAGWVDGLPARPT